MYKTITIVILCLLSTLLYAQGNSEVKKANSLMQQAAVKLLVDKDYYAAINIYEQASKIYLKNGGRTNRKYLEATKCMGDCYIQINKTQKAIDCFQIILKHSDLWMLDYACLQLGRLYQKQNNIDAVISAYEAGYAKYKKTGTGIDHYYTIVKELFYFYHKCGNIEEAIRVGQELCDFIQPDRSRWIPIGADLAELHKLSNNMVDAMKLYQDLLAVYISEVNITLSTSNNPTRVTSEELIKVLAKQNDLKYKTFAEQNNIATILYKIGELYYEIGNYRKAVEHLVLASNIFKNIERIHNEHYVNLMMFLSNSHSSLSEHSSAISAAKNAYNIAETYNIKSVKLTSLINYGSILLSANQEKDALYFLNKALSKYPDYQSKANIYNGFSCIYREHNKYTNAIEYAKKAVASYRDPVYLHNLSICYSEQQMYHEAAPYLVEAWEMVATQIQQLFIQNREEDRAHIWNKYKPYIKAPLHLLGKTNNEDILKYAFNSLLFTKSIQLASSINFRTLVNQSSDPEISKLYQQWLKTPHNHIDYKKLEYKLLSKLQHLDNRSNLFSVRWQDIQKSLKEDDLVVEFACIQQTNTKTNTYYAILLHPAWSAPKSVKLNASIYKLLQYPVKELYDSSDIGNLIWGDIIKQIQLSKANVKNIYFIPDGVLYQIALEYMSCGGKRMSDMYKMRRLSSSRDLLIEKKTSTNKQAALFGGIDYNTTIEDMQYYAYSAAEQRSYTNGLWHYLPGTLKEVNEIESILKTGKYTINTHQGPECVEETFKLYSTNSPAIVHIATHGFYLPFQDHSNLDSIINNNSLYEDDMLQRCGLVFAGANNVALGNRNIPDDIEDGILSASEIANLDLFNTEIVVMSACQTGLGTVGEDGVFGLQRAFKKAGAQSILMTLWSVDDNVTQKLMVEFYKGLTRGLSKYDALRNAQLQIRQMMFTNQQGEVCSGNNPYYWAPFVILD